MHDVLIAGVGIHPFGRFPAGYRELGAHAARTALADAGGDAARSRPRRSSATSAPRWPRARTSSTSVGRPGVPIINVEAACASSASTLFLGAADDRVGRAAGRAVPRGREGAAGLHRRRRVRARGRSGPVSASTRVYFALRRRS